MKFSSHYHYVILLYIARVCYVIFVIGQYLMHCMFIANLQVMSYDVYINAKWLLSCLMMNYWDY